VTRVRLDRRLPVVALVGTALVALALAGGGYSDLAVGVATAVVWAALLAGVLGGRLAAALPPPALLAAAAFLLALLGLTALSLSWTNSDESGFVEVVRLAGYLGVFLMAGLSARPWRAGSVLAGIALAGVVVALVAIGSRLLGIGDGDAGLTAVLQSAGGRLSYPIGYWNALGALMAGVLPLLCWLASESPSRVLRSVALAAFAPPLLAAYMASSRGALIAASIGLAVAVGFAVDRCRSAAAVLLGIAAGLPAVLAATLSPGILDSPGDGSPGGAELAVLATLLGGMALAGGFGPRLLEPLSRTRLLAPRVRPRTAILGLLGAGALLITLAGPAALIGDLRAGTEGSQEGRTVGIISATGSGRAQFWDVAIQAFGTEPGRGIGAGGYEAFWNQNGSLLTPARNAHSEPLELLAELGLIGLACMLGFLAVVLVCGVRSARRREGGHFAAALGIVVAGLVGFAIDWTWQMPAVVAPVLIAAGTLAGTAPGGVRAALRPGRARAAAVALGVVAVAVPALWASGVLAVASSRLDASSDAFARGQLEEAAVAARGAAAIEPWAAEPWLRLAQIEQAADNLAAAQLAVEAAIERGPQDLRPWVFATNLQVQLGNREATVAYAARTIKLGPSD